MWVICAGKITQREKIRAAKLGRVIDFDLCGFYRNISRRDLSSRGCRDSSAEIPQKLERDAGERREDFNERARPLRAASRRGATYSFE